MKNNKIHKGINMNLKICLYGLSLCGSVWGAYITKAGGLHLLFLITGTCSATWFYLNTMFLKTELRI